MRAAAIIPYPTASPCLIRVYLRGGLQAMPHGVAEIQYAPQIAFLLVVHHDIGFDRSATSDKPFDSLGIASQKRRRVPFEVLEQLRIANDPYLSAS